MPSAAARSARTAHRGAASAGGLLGGAIGGGSVDGGACGSATRTRATSWSGRSRPGSRPCASSVSMSGTATRTIQQSSPVTWSRRAPRDARRWTAEHALVVAGPDDRLDREADGLEVDHRLVAADDPGVLQPAHAVGDGGRRERHPPAQLAERAVGRRPAAAWRIAQSVSSRRFRRIEGHGPMIQRMPRWDNPNTFDQSVQSTLSAFVPWRHGPPPPFPSAAGWRPSRPPPLRWPPATSSPGCPSRPTRATSPPTWPPAFPTSSSSTRARPRRVRRLPHPGRREPPARHHRRRDRAAHSTRMRSTSPTAGVPPATRRPREPPRSPRSASRSRSCSAASAPGRPRASTSRAPTRRPSRPRLRLLTDRPGGQPERSAACRRARLEAEPLVASPPERWSAARRAPAARLRRAPPRRAPRRLGRAAVHRAASVPAGQEARHRGERRPGARLRLGTPSVAPASSRDRSSAERRGDVGPATRPPAHGRRRGVNDPIRVTVAARLEPAPMGTGPGDDGRTPRPTAAGSSRSSRCRW